MDDDVGGEPDLTARCERTPLLRPKSGGNPTSAANGGVWTLSCEILLPPPGFACSMFRQWYWVDRAKVD